MKRKNSTTLIIGLGLSLLLFSAFRFAGNGDPLVKIPSTWPKPTYDFDRNPISAEKVELGRRLFYDPILSRDSTISCGSCHLSYTAFTHVDHSLSHGIEDKIGTRNSPALMNLAWGKLLMWDGAVNHLDMQALAPISNPVEMDESIEHVVNKLQRTSFYPKLFSAAYGDSSITGERVLKSMSQFMLTLVSADSKYDSVMRNESGVAFTEQEANGLKIFRTHCSTCHPEPLFTTNEFANNGLPVDTTLNDIGRMGISQNPEDSLMFKIPTLRNIEFSYPYMHDGRFRRLSEVLDHYSSGIQSSKTLAPELEGGIQLTHHEKVDLVAFLLTLTDKTFLFNPDFAFPRK